MSRWDALRPDRCRPTRDYYSSTSSSSLAQHRRPPPRRPRAEMLASLKNNARSVQVEGLSQFLEENRQDAHFQGEALAAILLDSSNGAEPRMDLAVEILQTKSAVLSNRRIQDCATMLGELLLQKPQFLAIKASCYFIITFQSQLAPERVANELFGNTLLLVLESSMEESVLLHELVLETLQSLLSDSKHASALLTPLTVDINDQGEEETVVNPLKRRLFGSLQSMLEQPIHCSACDCLTAALRHGPWSGEECCLDLMRMEQYLASQLKDSRNHESVLRLLQAVLKAYPEGSTSLASLLFGNASLLKDSTTSTHCSSCRPCSPLLQSLHSEEDGSIAALAQILCDFLQRLPLRLWLSQRHPTTARQRGQQHFGQRVADALEALVRIVQCQIKRNINNNTLREPSMCRLVQTILMDISYQKDDRLCRASTELVTLMGLCIMKSRGHHDVQNVTECLINSMGGKVQPNGRRTVMALPVRTWLGGSSLSESFVDFLLKSAKSCGEDDDVSLLSAILRNMPERVLLNDPTKSEFHDIVVSLVRDDASKACRQKGMVLLENMLLGRRDYCERIGVIDQDLLAFSLFASLVGKASSDPVASVRTSAMNCYGSFLGQDWKELSDHNNDDSALMRNVKVILSHCVTDPGGELAGESNASVRAAACKATGDVCMEILPTNVLCNPSGDCKQPFTEVMLAQKFMQALVLALRDTNASVRSMALYALGNLSNSIHSQKCATPFIPPSILEPAFHEVNNCLEDKNDKVASNAIRTLGHVCTLLFQDSYTKDLRNEGFDVEATYGNVLRCLQAKVTAALSEGSESFSRLSWKQRSVTKKHGWGACHSLGLVLNCDESLAGENSKVAQGALRSLLQCIEAAESIHEKVPAAASTALRKISWERLSQISGDTGMIGNALSACLIVVHNWRQSSRAASVRLHHETALLLKHLILGACISDVCCMLKREEITKHHLGFLYEWMVENDMSANAFETIALALQRRDLSEDVVLEQKFASRALQRYRNEHLLPEKESTTDTSDQASLGFAIIATQEDDEL